MSLTNLIISIEANGDFLYTDLQQYWISTPETSISWLLCCNKWLVLEFASPRMKSSTFNLTQEPMLHHMFCLIFTMLSANLLKRNHHSNHRSNLLQCRNRINLIPMWDHQWKGWINVIPTMKCKVCKYSCILLGISITISNAKFKQLYMKDQQ